MMSTSSIYCWTVALTISAAILSHVTSVINDQLLICPARCTCLSLVSSSSPATSGLTLNCTGGISADLTSPTFRLPHRTEVLTVTGSSSGIDLLSLATVLLRDATALTDLTINRVRLQSLNGLAAPETLVNLDLSHNLLSMIQDRAFVRVTGLRQLDLSYNRLEVINHEAFFGLRDLTRLDLSSNRLATNTDGVGTGASVGVMSTRWICCLPSVVQLNLSRNGYHVIHDSFFDCRTQLTAANRNNRVSHRRSVAVATTATVSSSPAAETTTTQSPFVTSSPPLQDLDLSFNRIRHVTEHAFVGLNSVSELRLNDNAMTSIPAAAIRQMSLVTNVSGLDLSGNEMEVIDTGSFHNNHRLVRLQLNRLDRLRLVESNAFVNMTSLMTLEMSNCRHLRYLHRDSFKAVPALTSLFLNGGNLETLEQEVVRPLINLKLLDLRSNPLRRDCTTEWIRVSSDDSFTSVTGNSSLFRIEVDPLVCQEHSGQENGSRDLKASAKLSAEQHNEVLPTVTAAAVSSAFLAPPSSLPQSTLSGTDTTLTSSSTSAAVNPAQWKYSVESRRNSTRLSGTAAAEGRPPVSSTTSTAAAGRRADRSSGQSVSSAASAHQHTEVAGPCRPRILTMFDTDIHVAVTDTLRLDCIAVGLSELSTSWVFPVSEASDDVIIGDDNKAEQYDDNAQNSLTQVTAVNGQLLIRAVTLHHHGNYTCLAAVANGNGSWSPVDERTVRVHVKSPNTGLIVLRMTSSTVTVTWRGLQPSREYRVRYREKWRRHGNNNSTGSHVTPLDSADVIIKPYMRSFTASDLIPDTEYLFCIDVRQSPTSVATGSSIHESPMQAAMLAYPYPGIPSLPFVTVNCTVVITRHRKYADQLVRSRGVHILVLCATAFASASLVVALATFVTKRYDRRKQRQLAAAAAALDSSSIIVTSSLDTSQLQLTSSGSMTSCMTSSLTFENRGAAVHGAGTDQDDYDYVPMFDSDDLEEIRMTTSMQL